MEEDIKNVEHAIKNFNGRAIDCISIGKLLKAYKELKEENKELKENCKKCVVRDRLHEYVENTIPKSKAKEKLKELDKQEKEELKGMKGQDRYFVKQMYNYKRQGIEELLESGD